MYERSSEPLLPRPRFIRRIVLHLLCAAGLVGGSLALGTVGYHDIGKLGWIDAFLNSAMLLGGMGPVDVLQSNAAKYFASFYALFSGITFLSTVVVLIAPIVHRVMHRFHLETEEDEEKKEK